MTDLARRPLFALLVLDALEEAGAVAQALHPLLLERPAAAGDVAGVGEDAAGALFLPGREERHPEVGERALRGLHLAGPRQEIDRLLELAPLVVHPAQRGERELLEL